MVPAMGMKCSWGTFALAYMSRFASVVNFDQNQLISSVNSAECGKQIQRMSVSFT